MLPNENDVRLHLQAELQIQLDYSEKVLQWVIDAIVGRLHRKDGVSRGTTVAAVSLIARACRLFRQVNLLCEAGQADGLDILCRAMFDGYLSLAFVCRDSVELKGWNKKFTKLYEHPLDRVFRAALYIAFGAIKREKLAQNIAEQMGNKPEDNVPLGDVEGFKQHVGKEWTQVLRNYNTCAGLSIVNFADSVGALSWYKTIYCGHSSSTHASDPDRYVQFASGDLNSPILCFDDDIRPTKYALSIANGLLALSVGEFSNLLNRNHQRYRDLNIFADSMEEIRAVFYRGVIPPWYQ